VILVSPTAEGHTGVWLLELVAGYAVRVATRPVSAGGYQWTGGLVSPTVSTASASVAVEVMGIDWPALIARGLDPGLLRGRLWLWHEGETLAQAWLVRSGPVEAPDVGDLGDSVTLSIGYAPWEDLVQIPAPTAVCDESTWPVNTAYSLPETAAGSPYPMIIGQPGTSLTVAGGARVLGPGSPAYLVEYNRSTSILAWLDSKLLIAGHAVAAANVRIVDVSDGETETRPVSQTSDRAGRVVSYVNWTGTGAGGTSPNPEHEYWIAWDSGGGVMGDDRTAIRGLGGLLVHLFGSDLFRSDSRVAVPFDAQAQRSYAAYLDRYLIDAAITEQTDAWAIASEIAQVIPIEWAWGRSGGAWVPMRYDATAADAVGHIRIGQGTGVERVGNVRQPDQSAIPSELVLDYSIESRTYAKRARLATTARAAAARAQTPAVEPSALCDLAWGRRVSRLGDAFGLATWSRSTRYVCDDGTAMAILRAAAARECAPPATCTVRGGRALGAYGPGSVVTVTDDLHWTDRLALVGEATTDGQMWQLELRVLAEPLRRGVLS